MQLKTKYVLAGQFDVARQEQLSRTVAGALGFDWSVGRFDQSVHPFTGGPHPTDVRITTRFSESDLLSALMGELSTTFDSFFHLTLSTFTKAYLTHSPPGGLRRRCWARNPSWGSGV